MKHPRFSLERTLALFLALTMACPLCAQTLDGQVSPQSSSSAAGDAAAGDAPIRPRADQSASGGVGNADVSRGSQPLQQAPVEGASQSSAPPSTGTALAPYQKQEGTTGSKPAGAAIAPGKQRRTRSFAIRVGLLVGAAIAIGVVAGASMGSPARAN